jgi:thiamine-monophosphate kinase
MSLGEFDIIARYFTRRSARSDVALGVGDDAAILDVAPGRKLVAAVDTIVEGVHFPVGTAAADIGYRALAVNLSDLAAMGAEPTWMLLSLSLPTADSRWLEDFARGLFEIADTHNVALVGGDTVRGPLVITVSLLGFVEADRWLTRAGAQPGDVLFVSGCVGEAAAGLALVQQSCGTDAPAAHLRERFLRPTPRVALGRALRTVASAAMDVSDGLIVDVSKLCAASGCGARLEVERLPPSLAAQTHFAPERCLDYALSGGDDYELIFTVPEATAMNLPASVLAAGVSTAIGIITAGSGVECVRNGQRFVPRASGYDHFGRKVAP